MSNIRINIKFFGAFRKFGDGIELSIPTGSNIIEVKKYLKDKLKGEGLVNDSVLANDNAILRDNDILDIDQTLSILPPVCGG